MQTCPKCFKQSPQDAAFCGFCGASLARPQEDAKRTVFGYVAGETAEPNPPTPQPAPKPWAAPTMPIEQPPEEPPDPETACETIAGRYQLRQERNQLPVGVEWGASDKNDGREVALLLVDLSVFPSPLDLERARREMRQLQKVDTPEILKIIDHGKHGDQLFVATEQTDGRSLGELLAGGKLALGLAQSLVQQVGAALAEAQKVGVIHRDIAPHNVLVGPDKSVKLRGFGVAPVIRRNVFGTPLYISPEQAAGRPVDQRSNIYSLGALMYHMLAGAPPFSGSTEELLAHHQKTEPPPLPAELELPPRAAQLIAKALSKSSSRRHLTLRQFLREVETVGVATVTGAAIEPKVPASFETPLHGVTALTGGARPPSSELRRVEAKQFVIKPRGADTSADGPTEPRLPDTDPSLARTMAPAPVTAAAAAEDVAGLTGSAGSPGQTLEQLPADTADTDGAAVAGPSASPTSPDLARTLMPAPADGRTERARTYPPVTPGSGGIVGGEMRDGERVSLRHSSEHATVPGADKPEPAAHEARPAAASTTAPGRPQQGRPGFRETMWFFKGEMESALAEEGGPEEPPPDPEAADLASKYADDGSLSTEAAARLSLRTGKTQMMQAYEKVPDGRLPGEKMEDAEFIREMKTTGGKALMWAAGAVVLVIIAVVLWLVLR